MYIINWSINYVVGNWVISISPLLFFDICHRVPGGARLRGARAQDEPEQGRQPVRVHHPRARRHAQRLPPVR